MFSKEVVIDKIRKIELTYDDIFDRTEKFDDLMMIIAWCECQPKIELEKGVVNYHNFAKLISRIMRIPESMYTPHLKSSATNFIINIVNFTFFRDEEFGEYLFNRYSHDNPELTPHSFYSVFYGCDDFFDFRELLSDKLKQTKEQEN